VNADGKTSYDRVYASIDYGMISSDFADRQVLEAFTSYLEINYLDKLYNSGRDKQGNAMGKLYFNEGVSEQEALNIILEGFKYIRDNSEDLGISKTIQRDSEAY
jgi:hypothetical protein